MDSSQEGVQSNVETKKKLHSATPLQDITAVNIVTYLWRIEKRYFVHHVFEHSLKDVVLNKVKQLPLPARLTRKLNSVINSISNEIDSWMFSFYFCIFGAQFYTEYIGHVAHFVNYIDWDATGKINLRQTTKNILENENWLTEEELLEVEVERRI